MKTIFLISCASKKRDTPSKAKELYISPLFKLHWEYAKTRNPDVIYILSEEYKLLDPEKKVAPYEASLKSMPDKRVREWANDVLTQLKTKHDIKTCHFVFLAGERYRKYLIPHLNSFEIPLDGLRIGEQLHWFKKAITK